MQSYECLRQRYRVPGCCRHSEQCVIAGILQCLQHNAPVRPQPVSARGHHGHNSNLNSCMCAGSPTANFAAWATCQCSYLKPLQAPACPRHYSQSSEAAYPIVYTQPKAALAALGGPHRGCMTQFQRTCRNCCSSATTLVNRGRSEGSNAIARLQSAASCGGIPSGMASACFFRATWQMTYRTGGAVVHATAQTAATYSTVLGPGGQPGYGYLVTRAAG